MRRSKLRSRTSRTSRTFALIAVVVVTASVAPRSAHADEAPAETSGWLTPAAVAAPRILLTHAESLALAGPRLPNPFGDPTRELRLSSGAKTAIIITAIIVGALLIVGVVVVAKPGKHP